MLEGYIEEELEDQRRYLMLARQAPAWARQTLREIAEDEGAHARRLLSARYLITGQCYRPNMVQGQLCMGDWCGALRQCYHEEACGGFNYARTADSTSDVCLTRLLNELSSDEYRHAGAGDEPAGAQPDPPDILLRGELPGLPEFFGGPGVVLRAFLCYTAWEIRKTEREESSCMTN